MMYNISDYGLVEFLDKFPEAIKSTQKDVVLIKENLEEFIFDRGKEPKVES